MICVGDQGENLCFNVWANQPTWIWSEGFEFLESREDSRKLYNSLRKIFEPKLDNLLEAVLEFSKHEEDLC